MADSKGDYLQHILEEYRKAIPDKLAVLNKLVDEISQGMRKDSLQDLRMNVHKMAGNAGTYGYPEVSVFCKQFEKHILAKIAAFEEKQNDQQWIQECKTYLEEIKKSFLK